QGEHQGHGGIDGGKFDCLAFAAGGLFVFAGLDDGGMEVKIVRHNGCAEDADADVEHIPVFQDIRAWQKAPGNAGEIRFGPDQFNRKAGADGGDEGDDHSFDVAESFVLEQQHGDDVGGGNDTTPDEGNIEKECQGDG